MFQMPELKMKRVLVVGIGGGCDAITAYSVAKDIIDKYQPQTLVYDIFVFFAQNQDIWMKGSSFVPYSFNILFTLMN